MPNVFSTYGLAMQGADQGQAMQQKLMAGNQSLAAGQIDLENLQREDANQRAGREAYAGAVSSGATPQASLLTMSDALAQRGDAAGALKARQAFEQLRNMGVPELVDAVRMNDSPGPRPDLLPTLKRINNYQDATDATFDGAGNLTVKHASGSSDTVPIHTLGLLTGQFQPYRQVLQPGSSLATGVMGDTLKGAQPGTITQAPLAGKFAGTRSGVIYNQGTGEVVYSQGTAKEGYIVKKEKTADGAEIDHIVDMRPGSPTYGQEVGNNIGTDAATSPSGVSVRKDLPVLTDITKGIAELGGDYGQTDMSNPLNPKITLTPKGQQAAMVAEQIRQSNQGLAPRTIIDIATKGKPMWKVQDGKRTGVVIYNGQEFPMSTPAGQPVARPTAAPVAAPAPAAAPVNAGAPAPGVTPVQTASTAAPVAAPVSVPGDQQPQPLPAGTKAPSGRFYETNLENADPILKRLGDTLRLGIKNPKMDTKLWLDYVARAKQLGSTHFARGGKVSKMQRSGLGL